MWAAEEVGGSVLRKELPDTTISSFILGRTEEGLQTQAWSLHTGNCWLQATPSFWAWRGALVQGESKGNRQWPSPWQESRRVNNQAHSHGSFQGHQARKADEVDSSNNSGVGRGQPPE